VSEEYAEILLVEDDPNDVELALRAFDKSGIGGKVRVVKDGAAALDFLLCEGAYADRTPDEQPKVVLLDLKLPKIGGLEVLRRIKGDKRTQAIPVVALTSSHRPDDLAECYRLGVNSYVIKPIEFERCVQVLSRVGLYWLMLNTTP